jgi:hypothetical protein
MRLSPMRKEVQEAVGEIAFDRGVNEKAANEESCSLHM